MRVMVMVKSNPESESGTLPSTEQLEAMSRYNEELVKAGVMLDGNGLTPSADGAIVSFTDGEPTVIDGPFTEAKELVAGYWLLEVRSLEEAIEWVKRIPGDEWDGESDVEIRQLYEADELGDGFTDEVRERQRRIEEQIAGQHG